MTTETILTDDAIHNLIVDFEIECDFGIETCPVDNIVPFSRAIEQAVLQSEQVQDLRKDADRYRWLRDGGNDDIGVVIGFDCVDVGSTGVAGTYREGLDGEQLDKAIDAAMGKQE